MVRHKKILTTNHIIEIQQILEQKDAGFRKLPGTVLINQSTGESVYMPPQDYDTIVNLIDNMVRFMNESIESDLDPLIKMAIIHHQFESIHPFYDGNGRTGRIINILYLVIQDLLDLPILYLSRYIIRNKGDYYRLLQKVRDTGDWEEWIIYILNGIEQTARETIVLISEMRKLMQNYKIRIRKELPKLYSQDLLNNIFRHPYTKIEFVMKELMVSRITATKYVELLVSKGFLTKEKIGRSNFYINVPLFMLFKSEPTSNPQDVPRIQTVNPEFNS